MITSREGADQRVLAARRGDLSATASPSRSSTGDASFPHGITFGGHPVSCAVGLAQPRAVRGGGPPRARAAQRGRVPRAASRRLRDMPIVGDVRGAGYFLALELVEDQDTRGRFTKQRGRGAAPRLPLAAPLRSRADLPHRRPRRPGRPALAAAHRRARGVRRASRRTLRTVPDRGVEADCRARDAPRAAARRRHPARGQGGRAPGRDHARRRARARRRTASTVLVEPDAGVDSAIADDEYQRRGRGDRRRRRRGVGARRAWCCKVKEPQADELAPPPARPRAVHLPPPRRVPGGGRRAARARGHRASRTRRCSRPTGSLPLLAPMSEVAGRMATQVGARFLEREHGGRGVLLGGVPGVRPGARRRARRRQRRLELGVDRARAWRPRSLLLDKNLDRLRWVDQIHQGRIVDAAPATAARSTRAVADADLVIGAVLVPGGRAPVVVTEDMVRDDEAGRGDRRRRGRPGRLHRDDPRDDPRTTPSTRCTASLHYAVGNMPGAVPFTSTYALTNATLPYTSSSPCTASPARSRPTRRWRHGVNTRRPGTSTHPIVAEALGPARTSASRALRGGDRLKRRWARPGGWSAPPPLGGRARPTPEVTGATAP